MATRAILKMGNPLLWEKAAEVKAFDTPELHELVSDMLDTMRAESGAGLAAPQIGVGLRVVVFEVCANPRYPDVEPVPLTVLVNPVLVPLEGDMEEGWEACLSIPGMRGLVPRHARLRYSGFDASGNPIEREVQGFHARVVQHECDHLDGMLYPMRIPDLRKFGFASEIPQKRELPEE